MKTNYFYDLWAEEVQFPPSPYVKVQPHHSEDQIGSPEELRAGMDIECVRVGDDGRHEVTRRLGVIAVGLRYVPGYWLSLRSALSADVITDPECAVMYDGQHERLVNVSLIDMGVIPDTAGGWNPAYYMRPVKDDPGTEAR